MEHSTTSLIVMTGATSGLGLEAARALGELPMAHIIVGARAPGRAEALRAAVPDDRLTVLPLDTGSLASVRSFADAVRNTRADLMISALGLNAGMQSGGELELTDEGVERTFATNCLGHYALVRQLKDSLAPGAAVVMTASQSHNPEDLVGKLLSYRGAIYPSAKAVAHGELDASTTPAQAARDRYATSKFCCLLLTFAMARRTPGKEVRFLAYDPGAVPATGIARELGFGARLGWTHLLPVVVPLLPGFTTPQVSGRSLARLLTNPELAPQTGHYLDYRLEPAALWAQAKRTDWQDDLLNMCAELTGQP